MICKWHEKLRGPKQGGVLKLEKEHLVEAQTMIHFALLPFLGLA